MAAGSTYTPIATQTLGSAAATITFSSIPQTYTDLVFVLNGSNAGGLSGHKLQFNGVTSAVYSDTYLNGDGSNASSNRYTTSTTTWLRAGVSDTGMSITTIHINNYANTTTYKTEISLGTCSSYVRYEVGLFASTSAITSLSIAPDSGANWNTGTTATLYGITAA